MCGLGCVGREHRTSACYLCRVVETCADVTDTADSLPAGDET